MTRQSWVVVGLAALWVGASWACEAVPARPAPVPGAGANADADGGASGASAAAGAAAPSAPASPRALDGRVGLFDRDGDIGDVHHPGSLRFDPGARTYTVGGSGVNMWFKADAFHFVWKEIAGGDVALTADVTFPRAGGNEHRKAVLLVRQTLDADAVYADVALHGNGLTSLQYRDERGGDTHEIQAHLSGPKRLRIERRGDLVSMWLSEGDGEPAPSGAAVRLPLDGPFYLGLGVCAHDPEATESAVFSRVEIATPAASASSSASASVIETVTVASTDRRVVHVSSGRIASPSFSPDGSSLLYEEDGRMRRLSLAGGSPETIDTGFAVRCNEAHAASGDGKWLAISDESVAAHQSLVYVVPVGGGAPRRVGRASPAYAHGWSPDGKTLFFSARAQADAGLDVFRVAPAGGVETRLTVAPGDDDGPALSADGKFMYFSSERSGHAQIWRARVDGRDPEPVVVDDTSDRSPHPAPNGEWLAFLSDEADARAHAPARDGTLRLLSLHDGKTTKVLARVLGGGGAAAGILGASAWSPDGSKVAFVSHPSLPESR